MNESNGGAFEIVAVALDENAAGLTERATGDAARLVELQRLEQTHDERRAQVRLVLDERIEPGRVRRQPSGNPGGELLPGRSV
jgi:aminoglycoside phosphotransferase family enzyme